jgi:hypothetical protein
MMWKNTGQPGRPQITVRFILVACWIPKATHTHTHTHTHTEYILLFHCKNGSMNASMLRYKCSACLVWFILDKKFSNIKKNRKFIFLRYPDDGREHDRNMLVNSNMEYKYI